MQNGYSANVAGDCREVHTVAFAQDRPRAVDFLLTSSRIPTELGSHYVCNFADPFVA